MSRIGVIVSLLFCCALPAQAVLVLNIDTTQKTFFLTGSDQVLTSRDGTVAWGISTSYAGEPDAHMNFPSSTMVTANNTTPTEYGALDIWIDPVYPLTLRLVMADGFSGTDIYGVGSTGSISYAELTEQEQAAFESAIGFTYDPVEGQASELSVVAAVPEAAHYAVFAGLAGLLVALRMRKKRA